MPTFAEISEILDKVGRCIETERLPTIVIDAAPASRGSWETYIITFEIDWNNCAVDTEEDANRIETSLNTIVATALLGKIRVMERDIEKLKSTLRKCLQAYADQGVLTPSGGGDEDQ